MRSLLDTFIQDAGDARGAAGMQGLVRDIEDMLNHCRMANHFEGDDLLDGSILNYGLPPLNGNCGEEGHSSAIARTILLALQRFEPRLHADSIRVFPCQDEMDGGGVLHYEIEAVLKAGSVQLCLRLNLDTYFGSAAVVAHSLMSATH